MSGVTYFAPQSLHEAVTHYAGHPQATPFAGGTDLLVGMEYGKVSPTEVFDLRPLARELRYIRETGEGLRVGALTTIAEVADHPGVRAKFPFLSKAASMLGSWQVRNSATVGGNLCNGAPSAELTPCWLVLDAKVVVTGARGERVLPIDQFLVGPGKVALEPGELLTEIRVDRLDPRLEGGYAARKLRRSMDVAIVNMAVSLVTDRAGAVRQARVALGAVAPVAFRVAEAEAALVGAPLDTGRIEQAAAACMAAAKPISDIRSTAVYRREMVGVYIRQILTELGKGGAE